MNKKIIKFKVPVNSQMHEALKTLKSFKQLKLSVDEKKELNTLIDLWLELLKHNTVKGWHSLLVGLYAYKLSGDDYKFFFGGLIHDLGHTKIHNHILNSSETLTENEIYYIRTHVQNGVNMLKACNINNNFYTNAITQHHEAYDGTGYPNCLAGSEISEEGKIIQLADILETNNGITDFSKRNYIKYDRDFYKFLGYIKYEFGTKIDPALILNLKTFSDWYFRNFSF